ncbi:MAG: ATP-binding protein [Lentisphaeria bacterium]|nr:ATP-binding protein [Lentisphaeria bacterium]MDY0176831.1 ATP-binding protein [Lentisphaeria bacterium]
MPLALISQLELLALALIAVVLHAFRRSIGMASLYLLLGMFFIVALVADSPRLYDGMLTQGMFGGLGYGMMWLPFLLMLLLVYELEGTMAAHRFVLGLFLLLISFFCLSIVIFGNVDPAIAKQAARMEQDLFYNVRDHALLLYSVSHLGICILLPIVYQAAKNRKLWHSVAIFMALCVFLVFNESTLSLFVYFQDYQTQKENLSFQNWNMRLLTMAALALLGHAYIYLVKREVKEEFRLRQTFGFFTDFFSYFHFTGRMRRSLAEWSDRYQIVVNNSSELVFLLDENGKVINANRTASQELGNRLAAVDFMLYKCFSHENGIPLSWQDIWQKLDFSDRELPKSIMLQNLHLELEGQRIIEVDVNISPGRLDNSNIALLIARDMTLQHSEARKRQSVLEQSMHSQRLESIGQLAGGIAHDFNNLLQGIQANVETLQTHGQPGAEDRDLLANISQACNRAALLIAQLLGFARKGKFNETIIDVKTLFDKVAGLFRPTAKHINLSVITEPRPLLLKGDENQLTQVLLNLLINSKDALEEQGGEKKIVLRAEIAREDMPAWEARPKAESKAQDYICLRVRDNGCGFTDEVKMRMFDPFFTTKETGKGTGMGLAMVYGSIINHQGWLHVSSKPGLGSDFAIFLPLAQSKALNNEKIAGILSKSNA